MKDFIKCWTVNYANFKGRARRREFWMFAVVCSLIYFVLAVIAGGVSDDHMTLFRCIEYFPPLLAIVPSIAVTVRRLHDINKSGWYYCLNFIPFVGTLVLLYFCIKEGDKGDNQYGSDPKAQE